MDKVLATIPKGKNDEIRVGLQSFKGTEMFFARVFYQGDDDEFRPGKNGLTLRVELLPELIAALQEAEQEARAAELLPTG